MMEMVDPNNKNYRNYYGVRKGKENDTLLKNVTWPDKNDSSKELIITVYPTKRYPAFLSSSESCPTARIWASSERAKLVLSERMGAVMAH